MTATPTVRPRQTPPATKPDSYAGWDCTGAYLLAYAQPLRKIHLTGRKPSVAKQVDATTAESLIADGRGWSPRLRLAAYAERSDAQVLAGLRSWSPVVRERSAMELARRQGDPTPRLIAMLGEPDLHARLGACQGLIMLARRDEVSGPQMMPKSVLDEASAVTLHMVTRLASRQSMAGSLCPATIVKFLKVAFP